MEAKDLKKVGNYNYGLEKKLAVYKKIIFMELFKKKKTRAVATKAIGMLLRIFLTEK